MPEDLTRYSAPERAALHPVKAVVVTATCVVIVSATPSATKPTAHVVLLPITHAPAELGPQTALITPV